MLVSWPQALLMESRLDPIQMESLAGRALLFDSARQCDNTSRTLILINDGVRTGQKGLWNFKTDHLRHPDVDC